MNHIDALIAQATDAQRARADAIATDYAALSGLQPWTCPDGTRLALANIVLSDANPAPRIAPATAANTTPVRLVPTDAQGNLHRKDLDALIDWLTAWPATVANVRLHAPRTSNEILTLDRQHLTGALAALRATNARTNALLQP